MSYTPNPTRPNDLGTNVFSPAGNGLGSNVEMYTIYDRPLAEQVWNFATHVGYMGFATWLRTMGFSAGRSTPTTGHYETPWCQDPEYQHVQ